MGLMKRAWRLLAGATGLAWLVPALLVLASLVIVAVPDGAKTPLVPADGWIVKDGFVWASGDERELPSSLVAHPQARFWTSWTPDGRLQGQLSTVAFVLPERGIGVPLRGFPGEKGIHVGVVCVASGERRVVSLARTNSDWAIASFRPGSDWCEGDRRVRLEADVRSVDHELFIGSPFEISLGYRIKSSPLAVAAYLVLAWAVMAGVFWGGWLRLQGVADARLRLGLSLASMGLLGYAMFFVFWASVMAGNVLVVAVCALGALGFVRLLRDAALPAAAPVLQASVVSAIWLWLLVALLVVSVFALVDVAAGPWSPNARFMPARWSSDNQLPMRLGQMLASGNLQDTAWMGAWRVSDRPPLAYGWQAIFAKLFGSRLVPADGTYLLFQHAWPVGVLLNTLWAPLVFGMVLYWSRSLAIAVAIVLGCLMSPILLFNSGYIWPKLLAGAFGLAAAYLLFGAGAHDRRPLRSDGASFVLGALLSALALQSHGGAVFGILAMIVLALALRGWPSLRAIVAAVAVSLAIVVPWLLYQRFIDPPGNALLKFAFAGTFGFGEENMGVFDTVARAYSAFTPASWLQAKWSALQILAVGGGQCGIGEHSAIASRLGGFRSRDFLYVLPAMLLLVVGAGIARLLPRTSGLTAGASLWLGWGVLSLLVSLLLTLDCHIIHHQPYQALLALHVGLLMVIARNTHFFWAWTAVVVAYGLWVWVLDPIGFFPQVDLTALLVAAAALLLLPRVMQARPGRANSGAIPSKRALP